MAAAGGGPCVIAVDVGSSSVKAGLYDARAQLVPETLVREDSRIEVTADGGAEIDAAALAERAERVVDAVLARAGGREVAAVGVDTIAHTVCGVDEGGHPVTPLYTYADRRSREDVLALRRELDAAAVYARTGAPLHTAYLPARLRWLRRARPQLEARSRRFVDFGTYLFGRWFGRLVPTSYSIASWSGLLDRERLQWDAALLRHLGVAADRLPPLADYDEAQTALAADLASRWPSLREARFFLAVGDGASANVGSGCVSADRLALTVGTTGAVRMVLTDRMPPVPPGLWAYKIGASETLMGGALSEGGNVFEWARSTLHLPGADELETALAALPPDGHGLTVLPLLTGERSPGFAANARGAIDGLDASTSALEILQALLEAVCYRFALVTRLIQGSVPGESAIVASGGAISRSRYWCQLMADVLGQPISLSREEELTSRGTAILAWRALGTWSTLQDVPLRAEEVYAPDPLRTSTYQVAIERQHGLYDALIGHEEEIRSSVAAAARGPRSHSHKLRERRD
jgi:gluconokinase